MIPDTRPDGRPHPLAKYRDAMALKVKRGAVIPTKAPAGVGTEIAKLLESLHIGTFAGCSCESLKRTWDAAGVEWCADHRDELVAALQANGKARGWVFGVAAKLAAGPLVDRAIENARAITTTVPAPTAPASPGTPVPPDPAPPASAA